MDSRVQDVERRGDADAQQVFFRRRRSLRQALGRRAGGGAEGGAGVFDFLFEGFARLLGLLFGVLRGVGLLRLAADLVLERLLVLLGGQAAEVIADDDE